MNARTLNKIAFAIFVNRRSQSHGFHNRQRSPRRTVIIGGGITGIAAFIALVKHRAAEHIDIIDPRPIGRGVAFDVTESSLLCNTSVETMSVVPESDNDFLHYLHSRGLAAGGSDFVPRYLFGEYVRARYAHYSEIAHELGISQLHINGGAVAVERSSQGDYRILLEDGGAVCAHRVLVCLGFAEPIVPEAVKPHIGKPLIFHSLHPESNVAQVIPHDARVLVLGTKLSAIDSALLLCKGTAREIVMASPSGRLPAVRTGTPRTRNKLINASKFRGFNFAGSLLEKRILTLVDRASSEFNAVRLKDQVARDADPVKALRREVALAAQGLVYWQDVIVELVDLANNVLTRREKTEAESALTSCHQMLSRYLGAFPLRSAQLLLGYIDDGRLSIRAGTLERLVRQDSCWQAEWTDGEIEEFDAVLCAAGYRQPEFHATRDRLELFTKSTPSHNPPNVNAHLRVVLPGRDFPERIWLLGISSHLRVPLVNAVYPAAQQAHKIARRFACCRTFGQTSNVISNKSMPIEGKRAS